MNRRNFLNLAIIPVIYPLKELIPKFPYELVFENETYKLYNYLVKERISVWINKTGGLDYHHSDKPVIYKCKIINGELRLIKIKGINYQASERLVNLILNN